ncbi:MAG: hypothetical protein QOI95_1166 [Acidimicrobiaceae bacterium]|jgi:uncharacterized protein YndB with AHSA1/START domain
MKKGTKGEASVHIDAPPEKVYELVTDVRRMGEWSPECRQCEWLDGATGPAVGARFKGSNRNGLIRWSTKPHVLVADEGREFAFATDVRGKDLTKWSYRFEPDGDGTKVTESFEMLADQPGVVTFVEKTVMRVKDRKADLENDMRATLTRIKAAVEGSAS